MTWLYVPGQSISSPSAQVEADSISVSDWQFRVLERSVWWRGKPSPSRTWYQRWSRVSFIRLLYGAMPPPSTAERGVAAWTASLAASRASHGAWPEGDGEATTSATCGATQGASSSSPARGSSLSKTSEGCSPVAVPNGYGETFADLALRVRSDYSRRRKSARRMKENASLSSLWPTAKAMSGGPNSKRQERGAGGPNLQETVVAFQASAWPTPAARDWKGANGTDHLDNGTGRKHLDQLPNFVEHLWYTPNVPNGGRTLAEATTPTGMTPEGEKRQVGLENQARMWSTPRSSDGEKGGPNQAFGAGGTPLPAQAQQWATPQARDHFPPHTAEYVAAKKAQGHGMANLNDQADQWQASSLPDPAISKDGEKSSKERRSLNPLFVEFLMGWPPRWTLLALGPEQTGFAFSETAWCRYRQQMRSALSQLALPPPAPPAQTSLFG